MRVRGSTLGTAAMAALVLSVPVVHVVVNAGDARAGDPAAPPTLATPGSPCGPGDRPETGIQGRVSPADHASGRAAKGFTCNTALVGSFRKPNAIGTVGGFKVERYVDAGGRDCAFYDTTLLYPTNVLDQEGGVNVLDMSDPAHPTLTDRLVTPAMQTPHESLVVNKKRGLLAAVAGNLATNAGQVDIYDVSKDCRHPQLRSSTPVGFLGHESGMAPDGRTFYSASPSSQTLVAIDISNPSLPVPLSFDNIDSHGLSISDDGNRAYVAGVGSGLNIVDTSQVQKRVFNPKMRTIARLTWPTMSIPQNAIPITVHGRSYLVEIDEFGAQSKVGAGRIIDIADEAHPRVVSNLRLAVHQPENFAAQAKDNGAQNPVQGYAGHYCNVPTRVDPPIVACSMILSGLRVFDIRDPLKPREIAYFNAPVNPRILPGAGIAPTPSNWAMSSPSFVPERSEIWYSDGLSGFYAVRLTGAARLPGFGGAPAAAACVDRVAPLSSVSHSASTLVRSRLLLRGVASDRCGDGSRRRVARVRVSVGRLFSNKRCRFVGASGRLGRMRSCYQPIFLPARGAERWSIRLPRALPRGIYQAQSRAIDRAGNGERGARITRVPRNLITFRLR